MDRCKACQKPIKQIPGNHRKREYCCNTCKQTDFRKRERLRDLERKRAKLRERWGNLLPETLMQLDLITQYMSQEAAERVAATIAAEKGRPVPRLTSEAAHERARLHGYLDGSYLESTQRLFVRVIQVGQVEPGELREVIHQERGAAHDRLRQRIAELEHEVGQQQATNEAQESQQNIEDYREKLAQAAQRERKLEKQVDTQRQMINQYHARFYPSSLAVAMERLLALGAVLNYMPLPRSDELTVEVARGLQAWQEFARTANYEDMAQAILQAERLEQLGVERHRRQANEQEAAIHRLIVQDYAARLHLTFCEDPIPFEHNGTMYSIVTGNLANHKVVAKLGEQYETLEISEQEVTYFEDYCYHQLYQLYQARLAADPEHQRLQGDRQAAPSGTAQSATQR